MSEKLSNHTHESGPVHPEREANHSHERPAHEHEHSKKAPEKAPDLEQARAEVNEQAKTAQVVEMPEQSERSHAPTQGFINKELKEMAYVRSLNRVRKHLSPPARLLSRAIHQPIVNAASEVAGKTVGRPSGIFGGGLLACIGTLSYYFMTKHYGYTYNYSIFLLLMVGGFILGWLVEVTWHVARLGKR